MENAGNGAEEYAKAKELVRKCWARIVDEVVRFANKPITKKEPEHAADKAARRTALATIWIAIFTVALTAVGYLQYMEIRDSSIESSGQMDRMIHEYRSQVAQMGRQAGETHELAVQMGKQLPEIQKSANSAATASGVLEKQWQVQQAKLTLVVARKVTVFQFVEDKPIQIALSAENTGGDPAKIGPIRVGADFLSKGAHPHCEESHLPTMNPLPDNILKPGAGPTLQFSWYGPSLIKEYLIGQKELYVWYAIPYRDDSDPAIADVIQECKVLKRGIPIGYAAEKYNNDPYPIDTEECTCATQKNTQP